MTDKMRDICPSAQSTRCSEKGCRVALKGSFTVYCGEKLRDHIMGNSPTKLKMCDCIIVDSSTDCISVVELKHRRGFKNILERKGKAGRIGDVRDQFAGGLIVLRQILERISKQCACIQMVLYTKCIINDRSELRELRKPLYNTTHKLVIEPAGCGNNLPDGYVRVSVEDLPDPP